MSEKPECFGCFPSIPPLAETCYRTCKHSIILCKKTTYEKEHEQELPLVRFLNSKFDELQSKPLTSWKKSMREYVIDWVNEFQTSKSNLSSKGAPE